MHRITLYQLLFILLLVPALCSPCFAHKVRIFAWRDGDHIITESKFSGGRPTQNATVSVVETKTGQTLLSGTTDRDGMFSFPVPQTGSKELQIIVSAGDGHKNNWTYTLEDSSAESNNTPPPVTSETIRPSLQPVSEEHKEKELQAITASEIARIVDTALDKKLAPIERTLAENSDKDPSLQDILGGIGYILGLAGIAAYMQSRKKQQGGGS